MTVTVASLSVLTKMTANRPAYHNYHFCEDTRGRDGHVQTSESKETLYKFLTEKYLESGKQFIN